jgi:hypothetical protein
MDPLCGRFSFHVVIALMRGGFLAVGKVELGHIRESVLLSARKFKNKTEK